MPGLGLTKLPSGRSLPPALDVGLKVLVLYLITFQSFIYTQAWTVPYLPFFTWVDYLPAWCIRWPLLLVLYFAPVAIVLNVYRQRAAVWLGIAVLTIILVCKPLYSTSQLLLACLLLLIGLYRNDRWLFRYQLALLYAGTALNKALLADWWNGNYFRGFAELYPGPWWPTVAASDTLPVLLGIGAIFTEAALAVLFLLPRWTKLAIGLGLAFHGGMLLATVGGLSWFYFYLVAVAYLLLLPWPEKPGWWRYALAYGFFLSLCLLYRGRYFL